MVPDTGLREATAVAKRAVNPSAAVAGITVAALVAVGVLAVQAANSAPDQRAHAAPSSSPGATGPSAAPAPPPPPDVPASSGRGKRVVYSLSMARVWLVDAAERVVHTYPVVPGTINPTLGKHFVSSEKETEQTASDGVVIRNTVYFPGRANVTIGFSGTDTPLEQLAPPAPSPTGSKRATASARPVAAPTASRKPTGGIRSTVADSKILIEFTLVGSEVYVVE